MPVTNSELTEVKKMAIEIDEWVSHGGGTEKKLDAYQVRLVKIAQKIADEELFSDYYIIYECQAMIHWLKRDNEQAYDLILCAADIKDDNKLLTENGKGLLENAYKLRKNTKYKNLNGFNGWLALFCVSLGVTILFCVIQFILLSYYLSQLNIYQSQAPQYVEATTPLLWFEGLGYLTLAGIGIWVIILFRARKSLGRNIAIAFLLVSLLFSFIDYGWYGSISTTYASSTNITTNQNNNNSGRGLLSAIIWVPYLLVSKRVKRTLIR